MIFYNSSLFILALLESAKIDFPLYTKFYTSIWFPIFCFKINLSFFNLINELFHLNINWTYLTIVFLNDTFLEFLFHNKINKIINYKPPNIHSVSLKNQHNNIKKSKCLLKYIIISNLGCVNGHFTNY